MENHTSILSDRKLWENFLSGDSISFKLIYERSIQDLFAYGRSFCKDQEIVRDSIQDLFVEIYNTRSRLSTTDKILPYLMVVLKRILLKKLRNLEKNKELNIECLPFVLEIEEEENRSNLEENLETLRIAINQLTPRQQEAIHLKYVAGLGYEELALVMNLNYQTSRNLISKSIQKLRVILGETNLMVLFILNLARPKRK